MSLYNYPPLTTPVVFIIFNRPEKTAESFAEIAKAKPTQLMVIADGPRPNHPTDAERCAATRAVVEQIDWDCTVHKNYSEQNLGCKLRVASGLDWVFEQVEEAIIVEDDILVERSFFYFAQEMLEKYRHDTRIRQIAGYNQVSSLSPSPYSYFYSRGAPIWGWATWRRAWETYDMNMSLWSTDVGNLLVKEKIIPAALVYEIDRAARGKLSAWSLQWLLKHILQSGLTIIPYQNLVRNIGFGPDATHTIDTNSLHNQITSTSLSFPLVHPPTMLPNYEYDAAMYIQNSGNFRSSIFRFLGKLRRGEILKLPGKPSGKTNTNSPLLRS